MIKGFKYIKISIAVVIGIICLALVLVLIYTKSVYPSPVTKNTIENEFFKNKEILLKIAKYLEKQEYISIYITATDKKGEMFVSTSNNEVGKYIHISEDSISEHIDDLFEKYRFNVIIKKEDGIYFQRWSNKDYGRGVLYSVNGKRTQNGLITDLEPLNEENWYFYEEK